MDDRTKTMIDKTATDIADISYTIDAIPTTWGPEYTYSQGYNAARNEALDIVLAMLDSTFSFSAERTPENVHMAHCNMGDYEGSCKYGEENCPAQPAPDQWDTELRGPRMSGTDGNRIWKYQMPLLEEFEMDLPAGAEILRVATENGMLWMWAQVSTTAPSAPRNMLAFKAGGTMPDDLSGLRYVGCTAIYIQQELMLYFYEEVTA